MLTKKQHSLLVFIEKTVDSCGVPPSYDEMKDALGLASKSGIHRLITGLEERGFIRRLFNRARAVEVVRRADGSLPSSGRMEACLIQEIATLYSKLNATAKRNSELSDEVLSLRQKIKQMKLMVVDYAA